jgi:hypothetical protein
MQLGERELEEGHYDAAIDEFQKAIEAGLFARSRQASAGETRAVDDGSRKGACVQVRMGFGSARRRDRRPSPSGGPDRLRDVLVFFRAEIADRGIEPPLDLAIGVLGEADGAGRGDALEPRGDVDAVAHQIAVGLLDHVAEMNADPEFDAALGRESGVALDEAVVHLDRAAHCVDHSAQLDEAAVPGALDDAAIIGADGRVDEVAGEAPRSASVRSSPASASRE